jgi:hypothetical protein
LKLWAKIFTSQAVLTIACLLSEKIAQRYFKLLTMHLNFTETITVFVAHYRNDKNNNKDDLSNFDF